MTFHLSRTGRFPAVFPSCAAMDEMLSYHCKGRAGKFEPFAELFRTGLILAGPFLRPTQLFCFICMITGTRFNWRIEKRRGTFQKVLNSPGFFLTPSKSSSMRKNFCKLEMWQIQSGFSFSFFFLNLQKL